jgi:hypothetical protein
VAGLPLELSHRCGIHVIQETLEQTPAIGITRGAELLLHDVSASRDTRTSTGETQARSDGREVM